MDAPTTILEAQTKTMLEYLRRYEVEQIRVEMDGSRRVAAELIQNAHRRAREHMRHRIERERRRMHAAEQTAKARLATRKRIARHARTNALIDAASKLLPQALEERWANQESRADWCDSLLQETRRSLQGPEILVEHPRDWERNERHAFLQKIQEYFGQRPKARVDSGLVAGLRIHSGNAWLDGSINGLLAQQGKIKAELAALLTEARSDPAAETGMAEAAHG